MSKLSNEEIGRLDTRLFALRDKTINGVRSLEAVLKGIQEMADGNFPWMAGINPVVPEVERQLAVWQRLGVTISDEQREYILQQADVFEPVTDTDEPLVTGGFGYDNPSAIVDKLINAFTSLQGDTMVNYIKGAELYYAPDMKPTGGLRLVHYDPNTYAGLSPEAALKQAKSDKVRLASIEVLEHLVLNPQSGLTWDGKLHYFPNLSGLRWKDESTDWSFVPFLSRWDDVRQLLLGAHWADGRIGDWSSPSVRECQNLGS